MAEGKGRPSHVCKASNVTSGLVTRQGMVQFSPARTRMTLTMVRWKALTGSVKRGEFTSVFLFKNCNLALHFFFFYPEAGHPFYFYAVF